MPRYIGQEIGGYRVIEAIGVGGMAKVYKAYQPAFDRFVALKILPDHYAEDEHYLKRFAQEAKIIARLEHRHILPVYDFGEENKVAYLAMRYLQAGTLKDLIVRAPGHRLPLGDTVRIIRQIAEALDYAHQQKIVHRDVKPSNILVDVRGDAFLMDFGIAKVLEATSHLTATGGTLGTPTYMSPEQGAGKTVDGRSDVYSLGIILYELVVGRQPYVADTPMAVMLAHINEPLPLPREINPDVPEKIQNVILKALAKKPEDRFQTAGEMATALQKTVTEGTAGASSDLLQLSSTLAEGLSSDEVTYDDRQLVKKIARRKKIARWLPFGIGGIAVIIIAVLGVLYFRGQTMIEEMAAATPDLTKAAVFIAGQTETVEAQRTIDMLNAVASQTAEAILSYTPTPSPSSTPELNDPTTVAAPESEVVPSSTPIKVPSPTATFVPSSTPTPTLTPTPVLGIGSTLGSEVDGMEMVYVPAGEFEMGSDAGSSDEAPVHTVYLDAFWIDKTEVTNAMFKKCVDAGVCFPLEDNQWYQDAEYVNYPVVHLVWSEAISYCEWVGRQLPTEAQWEKAARGTDGRTYPWGEGIAEEKANYGENFSGPLPVGRFPNSASVYGALDMAGNVWEWVSDLYESGYYSESPYENPPGPDDGGTEQGAVWRGLRGGAWDSTEFATRSARRNYTYAGSPLSHYVGFRCAMPADSGSE